MCAALERLRSACSMGIAPIPASHDKMLAIIRAAEKTATDDPSVELLYWLGVGYRNFTAWCIRGKDNSDRAKYLTKSVDYFQKALDRSDGILPIKSDDQLAWLDRITIAGELGLELVKSSAIRDLDRAEPILNKIMEWTDDYHPALCQLVELHYKRGNYERAMVMAKDLKRRVDNSVEWSDVPAIANLIAKVQRAIGAASSGLAAKSSLQQNRNLTCPEISAKSKLGAGFFE